MMPESLDTKLLLKSLAVVAVSILLAGVFHIGWLAAFIPMAKSGVMTLKIVGWLAAPVVTAVGYAAGLWMGERLLSHRTTAFLRILVWPLMGCSLGATALCWIGPMWAGIGTVVGGAASVVLRQVTLLIARRGVRQTEITMVETSSIAMSHEPSDPGEPDDRVKAGVLRRAIISLVVFFLILAAILFLPAGHVRWARGWLFFFVFLALTVLASVCLWRINPAIYAARTKIQKGIKRWDKVLMFFLFLSLLAVFPVAGLDDGRFHWSSVPTWLIVLGYVLFSAGFALSAWAEAVNKFAEPGVRIQVERGHKVVDTGPYAIVRHPMYLSAFFLFFGSALALGSFWALIPAGFVALVIVVRTALEDRTLQNELEGYKVYASRVRYRLIPGIW